MEGLRVSVCWDVDGCGHNVVENIGDIGDEGAKALAEALKVYSGSLGTLDLQSECPRFVPSALHHQTDNRCDDST
eukprot:9391117-Pyramimonas_sp.AAC.1